MKTIPLTRGKEALVDDDAYDTLMGYKWHTREDARGWYAATCIGGRKNRRTVMMHRLVMFAPAGFDVDHIDHNGLNNQRANLRLCTRRQNLGNSRKLHPATSPHKGVSWCKKRSKWQVKCAGKWVGYFNSETEASAAYAKAAALTYGEFACA